MFSWSIIIIKSAAGIVFQNYNSRQAAMFFLDFEARDSKVHKSSKHSSPFPSFEWLSLELFRGDQIRYRISFATKKVNLEKIKVEFVHKKETCKAEIPPVNLIPDSGIKNLWKCSTLTEQFAFGLKSLTSWGPQVWLRIKMVFL